MSNEEIIQVCKIDECDNKTIEAPIRNEVYLFCCQKGFEISLKDFTNYINTLNQNK